MLDGNVHVDCVSCRPGTVRVVGAEVVIGPAALIDADGDFGGNIHFRATGGDLRLAGTFSARQAFSFYGAGIIEGTATGDLIADGDFTCAPDGCIGFSAVGVVDTSGGTFDEPIVADCPGSPSGAFLN
jgi:hypothetical protein